MAAPFKTGLSSFQLDVDFFADDRIEALSAEFGIVGELTAIKLLCVIYRNGYYIEWSPLQKKKLQKSLPGVEIDTLDRIAEAMVSYGLFDSGMFEEHGVLTSVEIQEKYVSATKRRKNIQLEFGLVNVDIMQTSCKHNADINGVNVDINGVNVNINSVNVDINPINVCNNPSDEVSPDSTENSEPVTPKVIKPVREVLDSDSTLELFNNPSASNNIIYQEKEKTRQKEKEAKGSLAIPFCSAEFVSTWEMLRKQPKWKKKSQSALQMSLNKLAKYPEEYAIHLMELSIANGWQGVVFTWTPEDFRKWQSRQNGVPLQAGNKKPRDIYESNMESMNEAFRLIDEKYGT